MFRQFPNRPQKPAFLVRRALAFVFFLWSIPSVPVGSQSPSPAPTWQSGQSNWNGYSYETLPAPKPAPTQAQPPSPLPSPEMTTAPPSTLELPAEPEGQSWDGGFGLSDSPLSPPVLGGDASGPKALNSPQSTGGYDPNRLPLTDPDEIAATANSTIGSAIDEGRTLDQPPLQEEIVRWYQVPWRWITRGWDNHAEFGLDGSSGN